MVRPRALTSEENHVSVRLWRASVLNALKNFLHCKDLCMYPYKIQLVQELSWTNLAQRFNFANQVIQRFLSFGYFHLNDHVKKQNLRVHKIHLTGHFFEDERGRVVTVNADHYVAKINNFLNQLCWFLLILTETQSSSIMKQQ